MTKKMTEKAVNSAYVHRLVSLYESGTSWAYIADVLPYVLFEVMALGPNAVIQLGAISAKLHLDDGVHYKLKFEHGKHQLVLYRMNGAANGPIVATFENGTSQEDVWLALHPKAAAAAAAKMAAPTTMTYRPMAEL